MLQRIKRNYLIIRDGIRQADAATRRRHLVLFLLTVFTLVLTGTNFSPRTTTADRYTDAAIYATALTLILLGYSLARYVQARSYGIYASLPFFIPMPLFSPFGTFGVVTRTANVGVNTRALFDVAFWGPATSFLISLPCIVAGIWLTEVVPNASMFEHPLLVKGLAKLMKDIPHGYDLAMHPLLIAGWAGILFTAINLFPLGSLSGGQIAYALFGHRQRDIAYLFMAGLFVMALYYPMWFAFVLIFIYLGVEHPELRTARNPLYFDMQQATTRQPLDRRRQYFAGFLALVFALSFTVKPFDAAFEKVMERPPVQIAPPDHIQPGPAPKTPAPESGATEDHSI